MILNIHDTGVWQAGEGEVGAAVKVALEAGYRHIDGAWKYDVSGAAADDGKWLLKRARWRGRTRLKSDRPSRKVVWLERISG